MALSPDRWLLGIDVGGTKVAYAVGRPDGSVAVSRRRPIEASGDPQRDLERIARDCEALLREAKLTAAQMEAVGVSLPGPLDRGAGVVLNPPNLPGWGRVAVARTLQQSLGRPVFLENDANAAALAEWRFGAGRGFDDVVYLTMSTGVGGGLILGGRLHRGIFSSAGEIGHTPVEWEGERCACGLRGCLEAYVGGAAWARRLQAQAPPDWCPAEPRESLSPKHVVAAAHAGDGFALAELDRYNRYLARGIVQVTFTVAPQLIVLGTIPTAAGEELCLGPVRARVREHLWPFLADTLQIRASQLGPELPALAGLCAALEGLGVTDRP